MKRFLKMDWDVIAGITAAVTAIVLHLLHVVEIDVIFTIILVLLALLLLRDLRRESVDERLAETFLVEVPYSESTGTFLNAARDCGRGCGS